MGLRKSPPPTISLNELLRLIFLAHPSSEKRQWVGGTAGARGLPEVTAHLLPPRLPFCFYPRGSPGQRWSNWCPGGRRWRLSFRETRLRDFFHCAGLHNPPHSRSPALSLNQRQELEGVHLVHLAILESCSEGVIMVIECIN